MKTKSYNLGALLVALMLSRPALADPQAPAPQTGPSGAPGVVPPPGYKGPLPEVLSNAPAPTSPALAPRPDGLPAGSVTSPWIEYARPDCCGSFGGGPIGTEYYLRTGPSIPVSTGILHETLSAGWMTQIGARSLFFNQPTTSAWTVDAGLSFTYNNGSRSDLTYIVQLLNPNPADPTGQSAVAADVTVTTREYLRWSFNMAAGRETYLIRPAYEPGWHWRMGWDIGGRWGASTLRFNDLSTNPPNIGFRRNSDVFGALALSLHQDIEIPLKNCVSFIAGIRGEWVYNWTDIVPPDAGRDLQDVNILLNFGWRY